MQHLLKTAAAALIALGATTAAQADGPEGPEGRAHRLRGARLGLRPLLVGGQARRRRRGASSTGADVQYYNPQVFDVVEQARLLDAAIAKHPDGLAVSIADADAMRAGVTKAARRRHPGGRHRLRRAAGHRDGRRPSTSAPSRNTTPASAPAQRLAKDGILKVVCINHEVGNVSLDQRCEGLNDGLKPSAAAPRSSRSRPIRPTSTRRARGLSVGASGRAGGLRDRAPAPPTR